MKFRAEGKYTLLVALYCSVLIPEKVRVRSLGILKKEGVFWVGNEFSSDILSANPASTLVCLD